KARAAVAEHASDVMRSLELLLYLTALGEETEAASLATSMQRRASQPQRVSLLERLEQQRSIFGETAAYGPVRERLGSGNLPLS
ncbi:MAG: hypothetical protein AAF645_25950, partial [Myxococcota bacterium]